MILRINTHLFHSLLYLIILSSLLFIAPNSVISNSLIIQSQDACASPNVVIVGASNTAYFPFGGWVDKLDDIVYPWSNYTIINTAVPGWGLFSYYKQSSTIDAMIIANAPDYLFLNLGGNDFLSNPNINATTFKSHYKWVIDYIFNTEEGDSIVNTFMMNIIWAPKFIEYTESQISNFFAMQTAISELSTAYNFTLIDTYSVTLNQTAYFRDDNIHMVDIGYEAIAQRVNNVAAPIIISSENNRNCVSTTVNKLTNIDNQSDSNSTGSSNNKTTTLFITPIFITLIIVIIINKKSKLTVRSSIRS